MQNERPKWDVPAKGESWTADQLAKYLGLTYNDEFDDPEKNVPPYLFEDNAAFVQGAREQASVAFRLMEKANKQPAIVIPNNMKIGNFNGRKQ